ncbi:MAG: hypothetical protein ACJ77F_00190 [Chloroflexota bacterium]
MDLFKQPLSKRSIAAMIGGIAAVALLGLVLLGGQTSSILSNVGGPIGDTGDGQSNAADATRGDTTDPPAPDEEGAEIADPPRRDRGRDEPGD